MSDHDIQPGADLAELPGCVFRDPVHFLAFGFGSGLAAKAPGTFGTLAAVPLYLLLAQLGVGLYLGLVVLAFALGIWVCERSSTALGVHDHGGIVWDEFVGFWVTMFLAPAAWYWVLVGFLLFRVFDILKPFPIGWVDKRVRGGFGIMIDDVIAGVFAWIVLHFLAFVTS